MNRWSVLLIVFLGTMTAAAEELAVAEIIRRIDATERVASSEGVAKQTIITSGGKKRTLEAKTYSRDRNDKQLLVYIAPRRVKGDKILMLNEGDDIWFYTPKTDRVRHLASHARRRKVQGSDFAYEDMAGGSIEEDYTCKLLGEEEIEKVACYQLELIPTENGPHYSKLILWAEREKFVTRRIDYFEEGALLKRLTTGDVRQIDGHWYPMEMVMRNLQEGGETVMETVEIRFDVELADELFTTQALKRR
ncbi:MAG: outer membrane lipoprotein-sorting protein [Gemmatimonadetes bacterium]|jgi:outer membrane lipoprotein-sorting protein|nr:outer membrane lipoprotein-sorting protein [Gemmatimonadota bacterium]